MNKSRVKPLRLNPSLLMSKNNGIHVLPKLFENMVFSGKSHELSDLNKIMFELTHWSHRLFPSISFDDFLEKVELLGYKPNVKAFVKKIRYDLPLNLDPDEYIEKKDSDNEEQDMDTNDKNGNDLFDWIVNKRNDFGEIGAKPNDKHLLNSVESNDFNEMDVNYGIDSEEDEELDTFLKNNFDKKHMNYDSHNEEQESNMSDRKIITKNDVISDGDNEEDDEVLNTSVRNKYGKMILNNDSDNEEQDLITNGGNIDSDDDDDGEEVINTKVRNNYKKLVLNNDSDDERQDLVTNNVENI